MRECILIMYAVEGKPTTQYLKLSEFGLVKKILRDADGKCGSIAIREKTEEEYKLIFD